MTHRYIGTVGRLLGVKSRAAASARPGRTRQQTYVHFDDVDRAPLKGARHPTRKREGRVGGRGCGRHDEGGPCWDALSHCPERSDSIARKKVCCQIQSRSLRCGDGRCQTCTTAHGLTASASVPGRISSQTFLKRREDNPGPVHVLFGKFHSFLIIPSPS